MRSIIFVAIALVAVAVAAPTEKEVPQIVYSEFLQKPDSSYSYRFETDDGTKKEEIGVVREALDEDNKLQKVIVVSGSYTIRNKEGNFETITYYADETGYHADGESIPKIVSRT